MNIIELMRKALEEFPEIDTLVHVDYNSDDDNEFGLYPIGDTLLKEDVLGTQTRQHSFILYAVFSSFSDYDRLTNSGTLLKLQMWLERYAENQEISVTVADKEYTGQLKKVSCANGMLYNVSEQNMNSGVQYQLQITAEYEIESEEF